MADMGLRNLWRTSSSGYAAMATDFAQWAVKRGPIRVRRLTKFKNHMGFHLVRRNGNLVQTFVVIETVEF